MAVFPFPLPITKPGGGPGGRDVYRDDYIQHFDCWGDEREEILVFNHKALYSYSNVAVWQKPRPCNNSYYPGPL
ncbi:MAG TPA: hypothetical protein VM120_23000 [Bryobacteraceae bacterium]|nr:hypothetical protein [Bryobacteraceae bacterium]